MIGRLRAAGRAIRTGSAIYALRVQTVNDLQADRDEALRQRDDARYARLHNDGILDALQVELAAIDEQLVRRGATPQHDRVDAVRALVDDEAAYETLSEAQQRTLSEVGTALKLPKLWHGHAAEMVKAVQRIAASADIRAEAEAEHRASGRELSEVREWCVGILGDGNGAWAYPLVDVVRRAADHASDRFRAERDDATNERLNTSRELSELGTRIDEVLTTAGISTYGRERADGVERLGERYAGAVEKLRAHGVPGGPTSAPARGGIFEIAAERSRQQLHEGWTLQHDDQHDGGELVSAARVYLGGPIAGWPWPNTRPPNLRHSEVESLAKAGALIAAEIDRLRRAENRAPDGVIDEPILCGYRADGNVCRRPVGHEGEHLPTPQGRCAWSECVLKPGHAEPHMTAVVPCGATAGTWLSAPEGYVAPRCALPQGHDGDHGWGRGWGRAAPAPEPSEADEHEVRGLDEVRVGDLTPEPAAASVDGAEWCNDHHAAGWWCTRLRFHAGQHVARVEGEREVRAVWLNTRPVAACGAAVPWVDNSRCSLPEGHGGEHVEVPF